MPVELTRFHGGARLASQGSVTLPPGVMNLASASLLR